MKKTATAVFDTRKIDVEEIKNPRLKKFVKKIISRDGQVPPEHGDTYGEHEQHHDERHWDCGGPRS